MNGPYHTPLVICGITLTPKRVIALGIALLAVVGVVWFRDQLDLATLHRWANDLPGPAVFAAVVFLPLLAFPVSVMHAIAGAKFGLPVGVVLVGVSIALQICASYAIVHTFPNFFARRFDWLRRRLPPGTHRSLTLFALLLPGAPYVAQTYVLPVAGVPWRTAIRYSLPINLLRSIVGIVFGEWSKHMTSGRVAVFVVYTACLMLACGWAFRRLRAQLQNRQLEESDPTPDVPCGHAVR